MFAEDKQGQTILNQNWIGNFYDRTQSRQANCKLGTDSIHIQAKGKDNIFLKKIEQKG